MSGNKLFSIGIDIGTTTFQMVISELTVENTMPSYVVPDFQIMDKRIVYRSRIYFTPMRDGRQLDLETIKSLLNQELERSGISRDRIESGAIIVTGEAANKENADLASQELAEFAGEFVVAVAGPDLEAALAGYGSGASALSEREQRTLANLDIGGGTTNVAVFEKGELKDCYALHIGGRLLRLDEKNRIIYRSEKLLPLFQEKGIIAEVGQTLADWQVREICGELAQVLIRVLKGEHLSKAQAALWIYHERKPLHLDGCTLSGGVGELLNEDIRASGEEIRRFGDIGPCLAAELKRQLQEQKICLYDCEEKIRATVIGAGMHSMCLSGSTICYDETLLPLKNRPVIVMDTGLFSDENDAVLREMQQKFQMYEEPVVFYFPDCTMPTYREMRRAAAQIWAFYQTHLFPILLIFRQDMAKAMGQTLRILAGHNRPILCIDSIKIDRGDYIDFCKAVGDTLLVTVKTLLYKN